MDRNRLAALVLALLACVAGCVILALRVTPAQGQRATEDAFAAGDDDADASEGPESERRRVAVPARDAAATPAPDPAAAEDARAPPVVVEQTPCSDAGAVLRVRVLDARGRPREDVRLNVVAERDRERGSLHAGPAPPEGVTLGGLDGGPAALRVTAGSLLRTAVVELRRGTVHDVDLSVPRGVRVEGSVRHAELGTLASVQVTAEAGRMHPKEGEVYDRLTATTDARGRYVLTDVPPGTFTLRVAGGSAGHGLHPVAELAVPASGTVRCDLVVDRTALLGVVRDAVALVPVAEANVVAEGPVRAQARTDADGRYRFTDLPPGTYTVRLTHEDHDRAERTVELAADGAARVDVDLQPLGLVVLRQRDPAGDPVTTPTTITLYDSQGGRGAAGWSTTPDENGVVGLGRLAPRSYRARIDSLGFRPHELVVVGRPGRSVVDVTLEPLPRVIVRGVVTRADTGAALAGAEVHDALLPDHVRATSDGEGRFELHVPEREPLDVVVVADGFGTEHLTVVAGTTARVSLRTAATLVLRIADPDGPVRTRDIEVTVGRCDAEGTAQGGRTTTDDDGVATWTHLVPGRYALWIHAGVDDGALEIELRPGRNEAEVRVE